MDTHLIFTLWFWAMAAFVLVVASARPPTRQPAEAAQPIRLRAPRPDPAARRYY